jgi:hypothetical protein
MAGRTFCIGRPATREPIEVPCADQQARGRLGFQRLRAQAAKMTSPLSDEDTSPWFGRDVDSVGRIVLDCSGIMATLDKKMAGAAAAEGALVIPTTGRVRALMAHARPLPRF